MALVVPRFGDKVAGGAELHGRWLAERLAARGHSVEIYTTCALDWRMWRNEVPPGVEQRGLLKVNRFPITDRDLGIHGELDLAINRGFPLSRDEELLWLRHGAYSAAMQDALARDGGSFDAVLALPYLFGTTYFAFAACPSKFVLIPCLHDESFAYLSFVREMLSSSRGLLFNTNAESLFARTLTPSLSRSGIVGVGIELTTSSSPKRRSRSSSPVLLYVGRREAGKNAGLLYECFIRYKERRPGPLALAFSGAGDRVRRRSDVVEWSPIEGSHDVYGQATIFCNPSINESLSIVLLQAWLAGLPAIVHGDCAVTREHCELSNGGLWFTSYAEFEEVMDRLLESDQLRAELGRNGREYVQRKYSWSAVLRRFESAMERILESVPRTVAGPVRTR